MFAAGRRPPNDHNSDVGGIDNLYSTTTELYTYVTQVDPALVACQRLLPTPLDSH